MLMLTASAIGFALSLLIPFLAFAASLTLAVLVGAGVALVRGGTLGETALTALGVLVACQVGYGLGLLGATLAGVLRRSLHSKPADDPGKPLERFGHERE